MAWKFRALRRSRGAFENAYRKLRDRGFIAAIREGREPDSSVAKVLPCYEALDQLERQLAG